MSEYVEALRALVRRSVAADEQKAHVLGLRVWRAAVTKSCVLMRVSRGGFEVGESF